ncbi:MAG TPA: DNRLRE domain-containing protein, partial [Candidatus Limnocylindrales bacterium]|nr:DNRLRE domain-containing protein [Candidatus Limnocylindrales bacterium]
MHTQRSSRERRPRKLRVLFSGLLALAVSGAVFPAPSVSAAEATFSPDADTYVDSSKPTRNFGSRNEFRVDGSPTLNSYIRFNVTGATDFSSARLSLYIRSNASSGVEIRSVSDTGWDESTMTWDDAPPIGPIVATSAPASAGTRVEVDVSGLVTQNGPVSFAVTTSDSTAVAIRSRESNDVPQLIVGGGPPANQDPVASFTYGCTDLACSFDGSASNDPDGSITAYDWTFGTDGTGSGVTTNHTFSADGDYDVTLTVTDNLGATNATTQ